MRKVKVLLLLSLAMVAMVASVVAVSVKSAEDKPAFVIRKVEEQVVLYTIYRGNYDKTGAAIGKLFALAGQKGIIPRGPVLCAYLNNPEYVSSAHWLTEIRIPVGKDALKLAGTLGEMTDVKTLSALEVAVAVKPEGQADPGPVYASLYGWILKQGYMGVDTPCEKVLTNAMTGNYAQMKTEIMIPVKKLSPGKD